jgi:hypothetical protein
VEDLNLLKLIAKDREDLKVLSACLQDGLIPFQQIHYDNEKKQFVLLLNRYRWEEKEADSKGTRIHSALSFEFVTNVQTKGLDYIHTPSPTLSLLSLQYQDPYVYIACSDNISIRLEVEQLKVKLRDADVAWPAKTPSHLV